MVYGRELQSSNDNIAIHTLKYMAAINIAQEETQCLQPSMFRILTFHEHPC
jgi:hypothetical protein